MERTIDGKCAYGMLKVTRAHHAAREVLKETVLKQTFSKQKVLPPRVGAHDSRKPDGHHVYSLRFFHVFS